MRQTYFGSVSIVLMALCSADITHADETPSLDIIDEGENVEVFDFAYGTPESPGLALAGLDAANVTKLNELNDFVVALPKLTDGTAAGGIDFQPSSLWNRDAGYKRTVDAYQNLKIWQRWAYRSRISLIGRDAVEDEDPEKASRSLIALGWASSFSDGADPMHLLTEEIGSCRTFRDGVSRLGGEDPFWADIEKNIRPKLTSNLTKLDSAFADGADNWNADEIRSALRALTQVATDLDTFHASWPNLVLAQQRVAIDLQKLQDLQSLLDQTNPAAEQGALLEAMKTVIDHLEADVLGKIISKDPVSPYYSRAALASRALEKQSTACQKDIDERLKSAANLDLGAALLWQGAEDGFSDFEQSGTAFWGSYRKPFGRDGSDSYWVIGATGRLGFDESTQTGDEDVTSGDAQTKTVWAGVERYSENWRLGARIGYVDVDFDDDELAEFSRDGEKWLVNFDWNLTGNVWMRFAYGEASGTVDSLQGEQLTLSLQISDPKALNLFSN